MHVSKSANPRVCVSSQICTMTASLMSCQPRCAQRWPWRSPIKSLKSRPSSLSWYRLLQPLLFHLLGCSFTLCSLCVLPLQSVFGSCGQPCVTCCQVWQVCKSCAEDYASSRHSLQIEEFRVPQMVVASTLNHLWHSNLIKPSAMVCSTCHF